MKKRSLPYLVVSYKGWYTVPTPKELKNTLVKGVEALWPMGNRAVIYKMHDDYWSYADESKDLIAKSFKSVGFEGVEVQQYANKDVPRKFSWFAYRLDDKDEKTYKVETVWDMSHGYSSYSVSKKDTPQILKVFKEHCPNDNIKFKEAGGKLYMDLPFTWGQMANRLLKMARAEYEVKEVNIDAYNR